MAWIVALSLLTFGAYFRRAQKVYRETRAMIRKVYGEKTADQKSLSSAIRAALWIVPGRLYHWRQRRWERRQQELAELGKSGAKDV